MSIQTLGRTIHTGCPVTDSGNGYGRCQTHHVRVYRDGHDWHLLQTNTFHTIKVLDTVKDSFSQVVTVTAPTWATEADMADVAGFNARHHFGYSVTRYDDGTASVSMWRD